MSKMHYFSNKFSKVDFGGLKLCYLPNKLCFFKLIMAKSNLKNQFWCHCSDVIFITSPINVTKLTSQDFYILGLSQSKFLAIQWYRINYKTR